MNTKPPSHYDGKRIGTAMQVTDDLKRVGVTIGPDQVERDERLRNLGRTLERKQFKRDRQATFDPIKAEEKRMLKRKADCMARQLKNGRTYEWLATYWQMPIDEIHRLVLWIENEHRKLRQAKANKKRNRANRVKLGLPERMDVREHNRAVAVARGIPQIGSATQPTQAKRVATTGRSATQKVSISEATRGGVMDEQKKEDLGAALLPADPLASPMTTEALPNDDCFAAPCRCCVCQGKHCFMPHPGHSHEEES